MSDSIVVSLNGDSIAITTESATGGFLLPEGELLSLVKLFVGNRQVFFRRAVQPRLEPFDWVQEMARSFGVAMFGLLPEVEAGNCPDCGRLVKDLGLCGDCAARKAGLR